MGKKNKDVAPEGIGVSSDWCNHKYGEIEVEEYEGSACTTVVIIQRCGYCGDVRLIDSKTV